MRGDVVLMQCPQCSADNPDTIQFCVQCHATLYYTCPNCRHSQSHGGTCELCGVDFAKYAAMLQFQARAQADQDRQRAKARSSLLTQILAVPITGGLSLFKYIRAQFRGK